MERNLDRCWLIAGRTQRLMPAFEGFKGFVWIGDPFEGSGIGSRFEEVVDAGPGYGRPLYSQHKLGWVLQTPALRFCIWQANFEVKRKLHDQNEWVGIFSEDHFTPAEDGRRTAEAERSENESSLIAGNDGDGAVSTRTRAQESPPLASGRFSAPCSQAAVRASCRPKAHASLARL
jgi:hypothetical protein